MDKETIELNKIIGLKFKIKREKLGLTQEECAVSLGLQRVSICNIETGTHGLKLITVLRAALLFKCDLSVLLPDTKQYSVIIPDISQIRAAKVQKKIDRLERQLSELKKGK